MYIDIVPNRDSPPAILLRESFREGRKVRKRTLANLTHWPAHQLEALRRVLKGETLVSLNEAFVVERSRPQERARSEYWRLAVLCARGMKQVWVCARRALEVQHGAQGFDEPVVGTDLDVVILTMLVAGNAVSSPQLRTPPDQHQPRCTGSDVDQAQAVLD